MALCKLERRNYGGKSLVSIKYQNPHSFKEGLILLCQSMLEMRIPLTVHKLLKNKTSRKVLTQQKCNKIHQLQTIISSKL